MFLADKTYKWSSITLIPKIFSGEKFYAHDFVLMCSWYLYAIRGKNIQEKTERPWITYFKIYSWFLAKIFVTPFGLLLYCGQPLHGKSNTTTHFQDTILNGIYTCKSRPHINKNNISIKKIITYQRSWLM